MTMESKYTLKELYFIWWAQNYIDDEECLMDMINAIEFGTTAHTDWLEEFVDNWEDWAFRDWDWNHLNNIVMPIQKFV